MMSRSELRPASGSLAAAQDFTAGERIRELLVGPVGYPPGLAAAGRGWLRRTDLAEASSSAVLSTAAGVLAIASPARSPSAVHAAPPDKRQDRQHVAQRIEQHANGDRDHEPDRFRRQFDGEAGSFPLRAEAPSGGRSRCIACSATFCTSCGVCAASGRTATGNAETAAVTIKAQSEEAIRRIAARNFQKIGLISESARYLRRDLLLRA